ncbi:hypothetical protein DdX_10454 [Ditylenchus destructor]|uniref:Uncharacterized protein n=1 Tax=Ditylenchus destructor TaxID=166010 RepID=A0AAD4QZ49_9BILA|nr:hypothetical protein DdX_10454 [Ditylenchus destructor]
MILYCDLSYVVLRLILFYALFSNTRLKFAYLFHVLDDEPILVDEQRILHEYFWTKGPQLVTDIISRTVALGFLQKPKLKFERLSANVATFPENHHSHHKYQPENDDSTNDNLKSEIQRVRAATGRHLPKESGTHVQEQPSIPSPQPMELSRQSSSSSHSSSTSSASDSERENDESNSDDDAQALENIVAQSAKPHPNAENANEMQDLYMSASDNSGSDTDYIYT